MLYEICQRSSILVSIYELLTDSSISIETLFCVSCEENYNRDYDQNQWSNQAVWI